MISLVGVSVVVVGDFAIFSGFVWCWCLYMVSVFACFRVLVVWFVASLIALLFGCCCFDCVVYCWLIWLCWLVLLIVALLGWCFCA